ncbi:imidazole glycerol phosphate synthase subunit HisH [Peribacillus cavernae]|uniref:Imidazole glycerol phosphate synthase subunit HisH n=1 Tax=Peribacillus cavernae TaxID=1674310 RepID=A0A3S1BB88_9BACI|nr:imidazole glycerol phosphate synthase subunit HisH [Peribacillus cavernae]MDQ0220025.1 glutamine amidotransferase [Peribacillus cavernae]RUQ32086.1 imidazole glycerol phosphate synthase subunit HisH [Peribacillus cavernae]
MIGIIDYGMGNLFSVSQALERLGTEWFISDDPAELGNAKGLILPGVGSFKDAMTLLDRQELSGFIKDYASSGKPLLGICLGMQLLFEESEENGLSNGLALLPGKVVRFPGTDKNGESYKVPHMGWNFLKFTNESDLVTDFQEDYVYFVHSYYLKTDDKSVVIASADYHGEVPAIVGRGSVYGMQFHPEKSSSMGMSLLKNYLELVEGKGVR